MSFSRVSPVFMWHFYSQLAQFTWLILRFLAALPRNLLASWSDLWGPSSWACLTQFSLKNCESLGNNSHFTQHKVWMHSLLLTLRYLSSVSVSCLCLYFMVRPKTIFQLWSDNKVILFYSILFYSIIHFTFLLLACSLWEQPFPLWKGGGENLICEETEKKRRLFLETYIICVHVYMDLLHVNAFVCACDFVCI